MNLDPISNQPIIQQQMKTSKIIFISLLGTIALLILITVVDLRINGRRNDEVQKDFKVNRKALRSFNVLYMSDSRNVSLVQNDSSYIEMTYQKDSIAPKVNYTVKDDTLMISDFEKLIHRNVSIRIHSTDSLKKILLKNSDISIDRFGKGKLWFDMDQSSLWLNQDTTLKTPILALNIFAKNHSSINSSEFKVDTLGIVLQNSEANFQIRAKVISGSLSDSSKIYARQPEEISLKKDKTSRINVNDY